MTELLELPARPPLRKITAGNFLSFQRVAVPLNPLNVLVGPNGAGKTNLLSLIRFLGETARTDLRPAIETFGGYERITFVAARSNAPALPDLALDALEFGLQ
jgi:predicted ATPase